MNYISITPETVQLYCRTCLNELQQPPKYNILKMDRQIRHWLPDATAHNTPPRSVDSYPIFVCQLCRDKLESFLEFHQLCSHSFKILQDILENNGSGQCRQKISPANKMVEEQINCDWLEFDFVAVPKSLTEIQSKTFKQEEEPEKEEPVFCSISPKKEDSHDSSCNNSDDEYDPSFGHKNESEKESSSNGNSMLVKIEPCCSDASSDELLANKKTKMKAKKPKATSKSQKSTSRQRKEKANSEESPQHVCEECGKTYKALIKLIEHQYSHKPLEEYPFHCSKCGKAFKTRSSFQEHQLRHAGIKKFQCPHCDMKKTSKKELDIHINYHTKERQWLCPKCSMIFYSANDFRTHDKVVHLRIRRFKCRYCDQAFAKNYGLKHHEMRHTGEKPHVCSECGKGFIQMVSLRTHMKSHNKMLAQKNSKPKSVVTNSNKSELE